jgi:hypothetical protein
MAGRPLTCLNDAGLPGVQTKSGPIQDANDLDRLRTDPAFRLARVRPHRGRDAGR